MISKNFPLIIAEIANSHNGDYERALKLIAAAKDSGADAIKFQIFRVEHLVQLGHTEYEIFKKLQFEDEQWQELLLTARNQGLIVFADVFGIRNVELAISHGVDALKVRSTDLGNLPFLDVVASAGCPVFLGVGGTSPGEIFKALSRLKRADSKEIVLLLGYQEFPTPIDESHLARIPVLKEQFNLPVGYADHIDGDSPLASLIPVAAHALGASVIEKHLTIGRAERPKDYAASIEPPVFRQMVAALREISPAIGTGELRLSRLEIAYAKRIKKYPLAACDLQAGSCLRMEDVNMQRVANVADIFPLDLEMAVGRMLKADAKNNSLLTNAQFTWKTAILLNARMSSKRLPRKALMSILGKPALLWLIERLRLCRTVEEIILCTTELAEDDILIDFAQKQKVSFFRGSTEDVMGRLVGAAEAHGVDHIVRVTGDDILSSPDYIDRAVDLHLATNAEYTRVSGLPCGLDREIIQTRALRWLHHRVKDLRHTEYMTWFLDDPDRIRCSTLSADLIHTAPDLRLTLDTPQDFQLIESVLRDLEPQNLHCDTTAVVNFIRKHPELQPQHPGKPALDRNMIDTGINWSTY
jgi:N,N'-diacetyllegionaminate synthase